MKKILALVLLLATVSALKTFAIKILHGPYLQNVYQTEATFVWISDKPSVGWVEMAPNDGTNFYSYDRPKYFDTQIGVKRTDSIHVVRITGLKPGVTYRYRVFSQEVVKHDHAYVQYGKVASTNVYRERPLTFKTLEENKSDISFVVVNDVHARKDVITPLMKYADYENRDLIFFNGDMVSIVNRGEDFFTGFMDECISLFAKNKSPYYVRGNHETRGEFATHFQDYFNPRQPHLYFTMHLGPVYFINLDTGEDKPDNDIEYAGITDYDQYRTEQAEWLKTVKEDPLFKAAKFRIVIAHMPTTTSKNEWHGPVDCLNKFTPILNDMDIDLMICGHVHRDLYYEPNEVVKYPVLVNSNMGSVEVNTHGDSFEAVIRHLNGKVFSKREFRVK